MWLSVPIWSSLPQRPQFLSFCEASAIAFLPTVMFMGVSSRTNAVVRFGAGILARRAKVHNRPCPAAPLHFMLAHAAMVAASRRIRPAGLGGQRMTSRFLVAARGGRRDGVRCAHAGTIAVGTLIVGTHPSYAQNAPHYEPDLELAEAAARSLDHRRARRPVRRRQRPRAHPQPAGRAAERAQHRLPRAAADRVRSRTATSCIPGAIRSSSMRGCTAAISTRTTTSGSPPRRPAWCRNTPMTAASCCCRSAPRACTTPPTAPPRARRSIPTPPASTCRRASSSTAATATSTSPTAKAPPATAASR